MPLEIPRITLKISRLTYKRDRNKIDGYKKLLVRRAVGKATPQRRSRIQPEREGKGSTQERDGRHGGLHG